MHKINAPSVQYNYYAFEVAMYIRKTNKASIIGCPTKHFHFTAFFQVLQLEVVVSQSQGIRRT